MSLYLSEIGKHKMDHDEQKAKEYLFRSLELLNVADEVSRTASFKRIEMKSSIEAMLQKC